MKGVRYIRLLDNSGTMTFTTITEDATNNAGEWVTAHLAAAIVWMATEEGCANQVFNVTNGDYYRWENLWPRIADHFGVVYPDSPRRDDN